MHVHSLLRYMPIRHISRNWKPIGLSKTAERRRNWSSESLHSHHEQAVTYDHAVSSPFVIKSQDYIADYERAINLSASLLELSASRLEAEKHRIEADFAETESCSRCESFVENCIHNFREHILSQVYTDNSTINETAQFILKAKSKLFRPRLGFMLAEVLAEYASGVKLPPGPINITDKNLERKTYSVYAGEEVMKRVSRLLQSYEIVHAGSLIHDDIVDDAETRRNQEAVHLKMGTKLSVLVGDVLLTRACTTVANLGSQQSTVRMAKALENLIKGELLVVKPSGSINGMLEVYLRKIFLKTASLIAECCASIADLFELSPHMCHKCYLIGLHVGMAFQIYDDLLDYRSQSSQLGKPALNDISSGLITMPLLFALPESPELAEMFANGVMRAETVESILDNVKSTKSFQRSHCAVMLHLSEVSRLLSGITATDVDPVSPLSNLSQTMLRFVYDTLTRTKG